MTQYSGKVIRKTPVTPTQQSASGVWKLNEQAAAIRNNSWPVPGVPDPISRSVRLRSSASAYFNRTLSTPTNNKIWTWSAWVKKARPTSSYDALFSVSDSKTFRFGYTGSDYILNFIDTSTSWYFTTTQVFRDPSAWYHIVLVIDTTDATTGNRTKLYINGAQVTAFSAKNDPAQNTASSFNTSVAHYIGQAPTSGMYFDGYMTEVNFIDGQALTPSSFGTTDTASGAWIPMPYTGTYGANGFYLNFKDNTSTTTLGYDYSGNANNWTANNISLTSGSTYDSMLDVPTPWVGYSTTTDTSAVTRGNYCVLNPLDKNTSATVADGNLKITSGASANYAVRSTIQLPSTGKWYAELISLQLPSPSNDVGLGVCTQTATLALGSTNTWMAYVSGTQGVYSQTTQNTTSAWSAVANGDVLQVAYDADNNQVWFGKNNVWLSSTFTNTGNPSAGTNPTITGLSSGLFFIANAYNGSGASNFGQQPFSYTPPTGYKTLCTTNLSTPTITNGANYMAATTYSGNSGTQAINNGGNNTAGVTFKPDLIWAKNRSSAANHNLINSVVGGSLSLQSNTTGGDNSISATSFNSNGFTLTATGNELNLSGQTYVGWQWQAGQGTTSSNTSGSITSTVSVNTTAGFSVVTGTSPASGNFTFGHGLGVQPSMFILKDRTNSGTAWAVWHTSLSSQAQSYLQLNSTNAVAANANIWGNTAPTSSVITTQSGQAVLGSATFVAYCWAAVAGYSAFGSYTGNGSADGPFVYLGFRPRYLWIKRTNSTGNWIDLDTSRSTYNSADAYISLNASSAEATGSYNTDILSNGFKLRYADPYGDVNASGSTYVYAAFAENPFKYSNAR